VSAPAADAARYFRRLRRRRRASADGRLETFAGAFAVLRDVIVDFARCSGRAGGEPPESVAGLDEADELYRFAPGFLRLDGLRRPRLLWRRPRLARPQLRALLATLATDGRVPAPSRLAGSGLFVLRYEYANFFHVVTDWYNAFLVRRFLDLPWTSVILADGHPATPLDTGWQTLFGDVTRISTLVPRAVRFERLVLSPLGWDSALLAHRARALPLAEDFRRFVLGAHRLAVDAPRPPGPLRVTVIRRQDYRAHARSRPGLVRRKLANEEALVAAVQALGDVVVRVAAFEELAVREQLALVVDTDALVGMHGAGLTHALFLPPWAGVIELFPAYQSPRTRHFRSIARWRRLFYAHWQNRDPAREHADFRTEVPPAVVVDALRRYAAGAKA
jgi:capsular polysaccharide biosynthesis protein